MILCTRLRHKDIIKGVVQYVIPFKTEGNNKYRNIGTVIGFISKIGHLLKVKYRYRYRVCIKNWSFIESYFFLHSE